MKKSVWRILFALAIMLTTASIQANATTASDVKEYLPSLGYQYDVYESIAGIGNMSTVCEDSMDDSRACDVKDNGIGGATYYYDKKSWRLAISGTDAYLSESYSFPMTAGKKYTKTVNGQEGKYSYTYTVESLNSTVKVGDTTYINVIRIKNEKGGYTYIAKNHGAILITAKRDGELVTDYALKAYKNLTPTLAVSTYTTTAALNVRKGAGTKYKSLGVLKNGTSLTVTGTVGAWYKVSYKGKTGYVSKAYVKVNTVEKRPEKAVVPVTTTVTHTTTGTLNVRKGAGTKYKVLGTLKKGTAVTVKGTVGAWYKIAYKGKTGYVSKAYVKVKTVAKQPEQANYYELTGDLNVRKGAGISHKLLGTLKKGSLVKVISVSGAWSKIAYNKKTGYVSTKYLKVTDKVLDAPTSP